MKEKLPLLSAEIVATAEAKVKARLDSVSGVKGWYGTLILFRKELERFMAIAGQTIISPILTTMLWYLVFGYSLGTQLQEVRGIPYTDFLVPGLVMMALITNAFLNSGFSFFVTKVHGSVVDLYVTPLTPLQVTLAYTAASTIRAMLVGCIIWAVAALMGAGTLYNVGWTLLYMVLTSLAFAIAGLIAGILAKEFDHVNFIPSFLLMPLTFLGGVFYSIQMLPKPWDFISRFNPIVYMVNGLRYGMTGVTDVPVYWGLAIVLLSVIGGGVFVVSLLHFRKEV